MFLRFIPCDLQFYGRQKFHLQGMSFQSSLSFRSIANKTCQMHFSELALQVIISSMMHFFASAYIHGQIFLRIFLRSSNDKNICDH